MAISDEMFIITVAYAINYIVLYRTNKLLGSLTMLLISIVALSFSTQTIFVAISYILMFISIIKLIYIMTPKSFWTLKIFNNR